jgi:hypothetical protein
LDTAASAAEGHILLGDVAEVERMSEWTSRQRSSDRPALLVAAVGLVAVIALSILVGFVGSPHTRFNWTLASVFGTAFGTTLLATATGWLAWSTRSEVRATQDLAELTRQQQAATDRPFLLVGSSGFSGSPDSGAFEVALTNVGLGPALMVRLWATYVDADWQPRIDPTTASAIAPGETASLRMFVSFPEPHRAVENDAFRFEGTYRDRSLNPYKLVTNWATEDDDLPPGVQDAESDPDA